jgi:DNA polymerase III subunit delta'
MVIKRPRANGTHRTGQYDRRVIAELDRHPHARAVLEPALLADGRASHAYLFHGPAGAGKRTAARAVAAELLAAGSPNPGSARARALSGAHPDVTWVVPSGAHEILVSDIEQPVVAAASKTPFEANRRVFVIERVDELGEEAANRILKTLEEPAWFVHMILLTDRLTEVLPTISSRCQLVRFDAPPVEQVATTVEGMGAEWETAMAYARLSLGDSERARFLAGEEGQALRAAGERLARAAVHGEASTQRPWLDLLGVVRASGETVREELERQAAADLELYPRRERKRVETEWSERIRRVRRRVETQSLDLGLQVTALWFADLAAIAWGAADLVRAGDRLADLRADAGPDPARLLDAIELVEGTRQRFQLNVSEELACEGLTYKLERLLGG